MLPNLPNMAKYAKYGILGEYLGVQNMVKWDVPGKILQNAVQTQVLTSAYVKIIRTVTGNAVDKSI